MITYLDLTKGKDMTRSSTTIDEAKRHAADLAEAAKDAAKSTAHDHAGVLRDRVAEKAENTANAANAAAYEFDPRSLQAEAVRQIAGTFDDIAERIRQSDIETLATHTSNFARRNPALFVSAAAIAGFAVTRFLKARDERPVAYDASDPWLSNGQSVDRSDDGRG